LPARLTPRSATLRADYRVEQAPGVAQDLSGGLPTHAQEALAVRILLVAAGSDNPPIFELDEHPAERRVTVHRAHRADDAVHRRASLRTSRKRGQCPQIAPSRPFPEDSGIHGLSRCSREKTIERLDNA